MGEKKISSINKVFMLVFPPIFPFSHFSFLYFSPFSSFSVFPIVMAVYWGAWENDYVHDYEDDDDNDK